MKMENNVIIDKILNVEIEINKYRNELQTLDHLKHGLGFLYDNVKIVENDIVSKNPGVQLSFYLDFMNHAPPYFNSILPSFFHWFGITICNYARLVGFIVSREQGLINQSDLYPRPDTLKIKTHCDNYIKELSEIEQVLKWRNKVAAHFALTDPRKVDNIATMEASIIYPVGFENNRYRTGTMVFGRGNESDFYESEIPQWSLTETFEIIAKRFWPEIQFKQ